MLLLELYVLKAILLLPCGSAGRRLCESSRCEKAGAPAASRPRRRSAPAGALGHAQADRVNAWGAANSSAAHGSASSPASVTRLLSSVPGAGVKACELLELALAPVEGGPPDRPLRLAGAIRRAADEDPTRCSTASRRWRRRRRRSDDQLDLVDPRRRDAGRAGSPAAPGRRRRRRRGPRRGVRGVAVVAVGVEGDGLPSRGRPDCREVRDRGAATLNASRLAGAADASVISRPTVWRAAPANVRLSTDRVLPPAPPRRASTSRCRGRADRLATRAVDAVEVIASRETAGPQLVDHRGEPGPAIRLERSSRSAGGRIRIGHLHADRRRAGRRELTDVARRRGVGSYSVAVEVHA